MVATVLSLKYRVVRHQLQREWWRALLLIGGGVWSLSLVPAVLWAQHALALQPIDVRADILVGAGALCVLGWVVAPLLVTGLDDTLDPGRFAVLGPSARTLMPGLTVAATLTIPAVFFGVMFLVLTRAWRFDGAGTMAVAVLGAVLTVASMVLGARVAVAWAARAVSSRRARTVSLIGLVAALGAIGPAIWLTVRDGLESAAEHELPIILEWLGRTPLGAGMAAPGALAEGELWSAAWRLLLMAGTVAALWGAWGVNVSRALVHPVHRGGGAQRRTDAILAGAADRWWGSRGGAAIVTRTVRSRALVYWATDVRYLVNAMGVVALPFVIFVIVVPVMGLDARWALAAPIVLAASIGWGRHNDLAYDSTALWMDVVAGRIGRQVMAGRAQAVLVWGVPAVLVSAVAIVAWGRFWVAIPGLIGACVGALGSTLGVSALSSVVLPYRAPAPGENPFGAEVGSLGASLVAQLISGAAMLAVLPLVTVPFILSLTLDGRWGWLALVTGVGLGIGACIAGVRAAGAMYDRRSGQLLAAVV
ncbi:hypothetical protein [Demequina sp. NBRC 110056]|uniref:hypothetical protein n=1 Tax=Demequina sp. NBRC 110056 TaxID=1570345 RepID=UPI0009FDEDD6|nr:hypothetical protein [Demequina sp. NBRC 110056]